ncbi:oligosaccharide flippase family protein [Vibrio jasicida]|uniref:oligosaccharide flippase family protein n=1 Tax=Vibrio jasicida TaxID=766224 RepID=UPI004068338A
MPNRSSSGIYKAILSSVGAKYLFYVLQIASLMITARFVEPSAFGVFAIIQTFMVLFQLLAESGFGPAVINMNSLERKKHGGIFTFTIALGLLFSVLFSIFGYFIADIYLNDSYIYYCKLVSVGVFFSSIVTVPLAQLQREGLFYRISLIDCVSEIVSLSLFFLAYYNTTPVVSLIVKFIAYAFTRTVLLYIASAKTEFGRAAFIWYPRAVSSIMKFSLYQLGFNLQNYFSKNIDSLCVGKFFGMTMLGVYDKSFSIMKYPLQLISMAMAPAIQPSIKKIANNKNLVGEIHNDLVEKLSLIGFSVASLLYISSDNIVYILLGGRWGQVVPLIEIFSFSVPFLIIVSTTGGFYRALDESKYLFIYGTFSLLVSIVSIYLGVTSGNVEMFVYYIVFGYIISFLFNYILMHNKVLKITIIPFLVSILKGVVIFFLVVLIDHVVPNVRGGYIYSLILDLLKVLVVSALFVFPVIRGLLR